MKSKEFIIEGEDRTVDDVKKNHPEIYELFRKVGAWMAFDKYGEVYSYDTDNSHMVSIKIKPSAGLENTRLNLEAAGIGYEAMTSPAYMGGDEVLSGNIGDMYWSVKDDDKRGNITEKWLFTFPRADEAVEEAVDNGDSTETKFRTMFADNDVILHSVQATDYDDDWIKVSAKGVEHFRAGTQEKIQFVIRCWWNPEGDEIHGTVLSQGSSHDTKYSKELDLEDDQFTLAEFAHRVDTFVSDIAINQRDSYNKGEAEYWAKGGRGMMPGEVKKDTKY